MYINQPCYENEMDQENVCISPPQLFLELNTIIKLKMNIFFFFVLVRKSLPHTLY